MTPGHAGAALWTVKFYTTFSLYPLSTRDGPRCGHQSHLQHCEMSASLLAETYCFTRGAGRACWWMSTAKEKIKTREGPGFIPKSQIEQEGKIISSILISGPLCLWISFWVSMPFHFFLHSHDVQWVPAVPDTRNGSLTSTTWNVKETLMHMSYRETRASQKPLRMSRNRKGDMTLCSCGETGTNLIDSLVLGRKALCT